MEKWIERQKHIIDFTLSSLLRRKGRNAALILVYTLVVFMLASVVFFVQAIKREASVILKDSPDMIIQRMSAGRHELIPVSYLDQILSIRGVSAVRTRLWGYYYDPVVGANYTLMVAEDSGPAAGTHHHRPGRVEGAPCPGRGHAGIQEPRRGHHRPGCKKHDFPGVGTGLVGPDPRIGAGLSQDIRHTRGFATDLAVRVKNPRELSTVALKVAERSPRHEADPERRDPEDL